MFGQRRRLSGLIICGTLLLTACANPAASESSARPATAVERVGQQTQPLAITPTQVYPSPTIGSGRGYPLPATQPPAAPTTTPPTDTALPADTTPTPIATPAPLTMVEGEVVLRLSAGDGPEQVGIDGDASGINGPRALRIGGDGTIRILDSVNKRVLFLREDGKVVRVLKVEIEPIDFIVNDTGEVFVYASDGARYQVLRYSADGLLVERLPISLGVSVVADGIMLNADQDLMLVQGNQALWTIRRKGVVVAPEIQPLTRQDGAVTPRSPTIFQTAITANDTLALHIIALGAGVTGESMMQVASIETQLPADMQFFNVDRAMDIYFVNNLGGDEISIWRLTPNGIVVGGARIAPGCGLSWRTFYIDQAGMAWTLCASLRGATLTRYRLLDAQGQLLPEAQQEAADVAWRPGKRLDGA